MNVPKLRFPGFEGEWERTSAKSVFYNVSNKKHNGDLPILAITQDQGAIPRDLLEMKITSSEASVKSYKIVEPGDFIISLRSFQGGIECSNYLGICSPAYTVLKSKFEIETIFFKEYLKTDKFIQSLDSSIVGIRDGKQISYDAFGCITLTFPSLAEQQKIASFLSSLDDVIQLLTKKKTLLENYKKGIMQKIFSQEIRFKDENGNDFPEWEEKRLGANASFFSGGTPTSTNKSYFDGTIPFIKSGEINANFTEQFLSISGFESSSAKMVNKGDLLFALYGATSGEVAISKISGAINQAVLCIRSIVFVNHFLLYFFQNNKSNIIATFLQGGQGNLSADIVKNIKVPLPSLPEQQKIADFLSGIDRTIDIVNSQMEKAKEYKKGLLQKMFV